MLYVESTRVLLQSDDDKWYWLELTEEEGVVTTYCDGVEETSVPGDADPYAVLEGTDGNTYRFSMSTIVEDEVTFYTTYLEESPEVEEGLSELTLTLDGTDYELTVQLEEGVPLIFIDEVSIDGNIETALAVALSGSVALFNTSNDETIQSYLSQMATLQAAGSLTRKIEMELHGRIVQRERQLNDVGEFPSNIDLALSSSLRRGGDGLSMALTRSLWGIKSDPVLVADSNVSASISTIETFRVNGTLTTNKEMELQGLIARRSFQLFE